MSQKQERVVQGLSAAEAATQLRELADRLESGDLTLNQESVTLEQIKRIKISLSPGEGGITLEEKWKARKPTKHDEPEASSDEPSWKSLKKRMRRSFKAMRILISERQSPPPALVERFAADVDRMNELASSDDPAYSEFRAAVTRLAEAVERGAFPETEAALQQLHELERSCHARYE